MQSKLYLFVLFVTSALAVKPLYKINPGNALNTKACKDEVDAESCRKIMIDFKLILSGDDITIPELDCELKRNEVFDDNEREISYSYGNDEEESAMIDVSKRNGGRVTAEIKCADRTFEIKPLGKRLHLLVEQNQDDFVDEKEEDQKEVENNLVQEMEPIPLNVEGQAESDRATISYADIKIYYTSALAGNLQELQEAVDLAIIESNLGYQRSQINLRLRQHGAMVQSSVADGSDFGAILYNFYKSENRKCSIRDGADLALLMAKGTSDSSCGIAYTGVVGNYDQTLGVVKKSCATGYYSFAHEIAHMMGALHNREVTTNPDNDSKYGELINQQNGAASGKRTIMSYYSPNYQTRINRYSSATQSLADGSKLGTTLESNVNIINAAAPALAAVSETYTCSCTDKPNGYSNQGTCAYGTQYCAEGYAHFYEDCPKYCSVYTGC